MKMHKVFDVFLILAVLLSTASGPSSGMFSAARGCQGARWRIYESCDCSSRERGDCDSDERCEPDSDLSRLGGLSAGSVA